MPAKTSERTSATRTQSIICRYCGSTAILYYCPFRPRISDLEPRTSDLGPRTSNLRHPPTVFRNFGGRRCFVACSYAYASAMSFSSDHAPPMNEIPTGRSNAKPAGTVMLG
jgi:hypothetical protein